MIISGWEEVVVCNKCGYTHSFAFAPKLCPKCAEKFYDAWKGGCQNSHMRVARRKLFGWEFLKSEK